MLLLIVYCILIVIASVLGGLVPLYVRLTHRRMQIGLSFVSGIMLGVALLHLLPHAWVEFAEAGRGRSLDEAIYWLIGGFLLMFLLERFFCFHHHEEGQGQTPGTDEHHHSHNGHACGDSAKLGVEHSRHRHSFGWAGAAIGMTVHAILEGAALAASVEAETHAHAGHERGGVLLAGLGTFLVIFLHKPFDSLTIGALMAAGAHSTRHRHLVNLLFALIVPLAAFGFTFGLGTAADETHTVIGAVLAFSAGMFLCIALSDLLPELQFHQHDRIKLTAALIAGLAAAWVIGIFEGDAHEHDAEGDPAAVAVDHDHDHDH